ncbi:MAG: carbamoyltransferase HypF [Lentisphaeria bacterium]
MPTSNIKTKLVRLRINVRGRVQGVGFRPTVYRYARSLGLTGSVRNDSTGVIIAVQGESGHIDEFVSRLRDCPPPQARIDELDIQPAPVTDDSAFEITASTRSGQLDAGMPPDLAVCEDCVNELFDAHDRRHNYPFLNCTTCGPRFSIIKALPYDRDKTSMAAFAMCPECQSEYDHPANRRFDAQPNACDACGPRLELLSSSDVAIAGDPIQQSAVLLEQGNTLAVKGLGGYHLACPATNDEAVAKLRKRKNRPSKALAVMFRSTAEVRKFCELSESEEAELSSPAAPIVAIKQNPRNLLSQYISPDTNDVGAFLPYTPLHHLLLAQVSPLVMTSANRRDEPLATTRGELRKILGSVADYVLDHNREIVRRCDDSVLKMNRGRRLLIRRSRGFVPNPVPLPFAGPAVLACGADMKNTFCITSGTKAYLSQHIGDLEEYSADRFYRETIADLLKLLQIDPPLVAHDMHADYQSTAYARTLHDKGKKTLAVQHHHAHIAACMLDNSHTEKVIGVALDGTGYGPDKTVWGGEFLVADLENYERLGHFKQYPMPGGESAARNPSRMALGVLAEEGITVNGTEPPPGLEPIPLEERQLLSQAVKRQVNTPLTSSAGRLFDTVAAMLGLCRQADYEGQAPMRLQAVAEANNGCGYGYDIDQNGIVSFSRTIRAVLEDIKHGVAEARIAGMFHRTVAAAVTEMCARVREQRNLNTVALSGGVFQNELLLNLLSDGLEARGFEVLQHRNVPPNDAGIALGQAGIAMKQAEDF